VDVTRIRRDCQPDKPILFSGLVGQTWAVDTSCNTGCRLPLSIGAKNLRQFFLQAQFLIFKVFGLGHKHP
jgi:hypothetical protein